MATLIALICIVSGILGILYYGASDDKYNSKIQPYILLISIIFLIIGIVIYLSQK